MITSIVMLAVVTIGAVVVVADEAWPPFEVSKAVPMTHGPKKHFFGYFGVSPWNASQKYMLCIETDFDDRMPEPEDAATIGIIDTKTREFKPLVKTYAWNVQQGAFQRWLPTDPDHKFIYNDRVGDRFVSVIYDIETGEKRVLPRAISALSHDGRTALCINYARAKRLRPVIGYAGGSDPTEGVEQPEDDGIFTMDIQTGETKLILSVADVARNYDGPEDFGGKEMWVSHTGLNPSDTRFHFLLRYNRVGMSFRTAMYTAGVDGSDPRRVIEFGNGVSHFGWKDDATVLATMDLEDEGKGSAHVIFPDRENPEYTRLGREALKQDGHASFSPDGRWMVTDTYPDGKYRQTLYLLDLKTGKHLVLGRFKSNIRYQGAIRCDNHPRWSPDGTMISFDSLHGKSRQMYVIKLKSFE